MNQQFIRGLEIDWNKIERDSYLKNIEALKGVEQLEFETPITFFVGENGSGKSTLLEAIAVAYGFNPEGGTKNYSFSTYDSHSNLCEAIRLSKGFRQAKHGYFLRAESFYNVATKEEDYADAGHPSSRFHAQLMERVFWHWHNSKCSRMAFIFWMSRRQRCHHTDS